MSSLPTYTSLDEDQNETQREKGREEEERIENDSFNRSKSMKYDKRVSSDSETKRSNQTMQERRKSRRRSNIEDDVDPNQQPMDPKKHPFSEMFGFMPFHKLGRLKNDPSVFGSVRKAEPPKKKKTSSWVVTLKNVIWVFIFGWWMSLIYFMVGLTLMLTYFGIQHGKVCWQISSYFLWPFGKYVVRVHKSDRYPLMSQNGSPSPNEQTSLSNSPPQKAPEIQSYENESRLRFWIGQLIWIIIAVPPLLVSHAISFVLNWMPIIYIPMAKVHREMIKLLFRSPRSIRITSEYPGPAARLLLGTFEASNMRYFRYVVSGVNVCLINLIPFIFLTISLGKAPEEHRPPAIFMFFTSLLSIIPTAYFIGLAVSSISAQSNFAVGALLNATFGSIVEIILYTV
eukprot:TRINITY_DN475_c2_g1_i6.p1 TRINITY_DN475_c2_g1~~TRINITY_DN475_c2_g1_i6.p1  ORF type:complete len:399 (+),score=78.55 TRINITY_DN475_c2_g1_i6:324-1520(+)